MKAIQCAHPTHCHGWEHWIVFMTSLYMYYTPCFVLIEHSVCHEPISVLIN